MQGNGFPYNPQGIAILNLYGQPIPQMNGNQAPPPGLEGMQGFYPMPGCGFPAYHQAYMGETVGQDGASPDASPAALPQLPIIAPQECEHGSSGVAGEHGF